MDSLKKAKIKIAFLGEGTNFISHYFLKQFIENPSFDIKFFIECTLPPDKKKKIYSLKDKNLLAKVKVFLLKLLQPKTPYDNIKLCKREKIKIIHPQKGNINKGLPEKCFQEEIDYIFIAGCDQILKQRILEWPAQMAINYHYSPLPAYRGKFALFWQWFNEEPFIGYTFHKVDLGIDTGEPILQGKVFYDKEEALWELIKRVLEESSKQIPLLFELASTNQKQLLFEYFEESYNNVEKRLQLDFIRYKDSKELVKRKVDKLSYLKVNDDIILKDYKFFEGQLNEKVERHGDVVKLQLQHGYLEIGIINNIKARRSFKKLKAIWK